MYQNMQNSVGLDYSQGPLGIPSVSLEQQRATNDNPVPALSSHVNVPERSEFRKRSSGLFPFNPPQGMENISLLLEPRGLIGAYLRTCGRWKLGIVETRILLGYSAEGSPMLEYLLAGQSQPATQDIVDRVGYVLGISLGLGILFSEDADSELKWLGSNKISLGGDSPFRHMLRGHMHSLIAVSNLVEKARGF